MYNKIFTGCLAAMFLVQGAYAHASDADENTEMSPKAAYMMPLASQSLLTDVVKVGQQGFAAVGQRGHILLSNDAKNWQQATVPVQSLLTSVYFTDDQYGWAVGHDATILHTQDGGKNWQLQQFLPEQDKPLMDIYFFNRQQGLAIGAYGLFFTTSDGGVSWQPTFHKTLVSSDDAEYLADLEETDPEMYLLERESVLPHFNRLIVNDQQIIMVGEAGFMAKSDDAGASWQRLEEFYNGSLFAVHRTEQGSIVTAGLRGHVFLSEDDGDSWQQIDLPVSATLNSLFADSAGRLFITGNAGALLRSEDNGQSFQDMSQADGRAILNGVALGEQLLLVTEVGIKLTPLSKSE